MAHPRPSTTPAPFRASQQGPKSKDGTTVKRAFFLRFRRLLLTPATIAASGPQPSASGDRILVSLAVKLSKGSLSPQTAGATLRVQGEGYWEAGPFKLCFSTRPLIPLFHSRQRHHLPMRSHTAGPPC
jgi:hypothetical protein